MAKVIGCTHIGKAGLVKDPTPAKTDHSIITVEQANGVRFKTLGINVMVVDT